MVSLFWAEGNPTLPQFIRQASLGKYLGSIRGAFSRLTSIIFASVLLAALAALVAFSLGLRIAIPMSGRSASETQMASALKPSASKVVSAPDTTKSCNQKLSQSNPLFASCPSFLLDYENRASTKIDTKKINIYTGVPVANSEAQYYTDSKDNLRVENDSLVLEAKNQPAPGGYSYTSARIDTQGKENFLYGKMIVRAMVPNSVGTWPAIWMLPSQPKYASLSPSSQVNRYLNDGEIDIVESVGTEPNLIYSVAHCLAYAQSNMDKSYYRTILLPDNNTTYHDYELDWTPTSLTFMVDGTVYYTHEKQANADWRTWPYDQPFYLVINLALGGKWAGSDTAHFPGDGIDKSALPAKLSIQSVRYYSYAGQ
jgi:beta-glucanase (GH16 family)